MSEFLTRSLRIRLLSLLLAASPLSLLAAPSEPTEGPAWGLIVKLRPDAAVGDATARERPKGAAGSEAPQAVRERLAQVLEQRVPALQLRRTLASGSHLVDDGRVLDAAEARSLAERLAADPRVEYVVPNVRERLLQTVTPNDPSYGDQWWLQSRGTGVQGVPNLPAAWTRSTGNPSVVVAVLDSGVTPHPELDAQLLPGYDFVSGTAYANDGNGRDDDPGDPGDYVTREDQARSEFSSCDTGNSSWHGTRIAGQIAAVSNNRVGVAGIAWQTRILPVRVSGKCGASVADIVDGMLWAAGLGVAGVPANPFPARILNLSFGGSGACNAEYANAIARVREQGAVLVTAAGNERGAVTRPGNCSGVITVGALNQEGFKATYSNLGSAVTLSTVGGDGRTGGACDASLADSGLLTLGNTGERGPGSASYQTVGGTSFSTPVVSGVAALMLAVNPSLSADQLREGLVRTVQPHVDVPGLGTCGDGNAGRCSCTTETCGAGILDAEQALAYAVAPTTYQPPLRSAVRLDNARIRACTGEPTPEPATPTPDERDDAGGAVDAAGLGLLALLAAAGLQRRRRGA